MIQNIYFLIWFLNDHFGILKYNIKIKYNKFRVFIDIKWMKKYQRNNFNKHKALEFITQLIFVDFSR
jgi:hypothetical protein